MLAEIRGRSQITIPAEIIKNLGISEGDKFDTVEEMFQEMGIDL